MTDYLECCRLCPHNCGVNRVQGQAGFCRSGLLPKLALVSRHDWEEPCISGTYGNGIMSQYTPVFKATGHPELNRRLTDPEYRRLIDYAIRLGVENAFIQDTSAASESFIPDFNGQNREEGRRV